MKKSIRTIYKILATLLLVLIITAVAFPFFFRDRIDTEFKKAINERIEGEVDYGKIGLSIFSSFPDLNVTINDLKIDGKKITDGQRDLFQSKSVSFGVDVMSLIRNRDSIEIKSFYLNKPIINIYTTKSGDVNYDIYQAPTNAESGNSSSAIKINLNNYSVQDANIRYLDASADIDVIVNQLNHTGDLVYKNNYADWNSTTTTTDFSLSQKGIGYLKRADIHWDNKMNIDFNRSTYKFNENQLKINDLALSLIGQAQSINNGWNMDFTFDSAENTFKNFISLLPNIYSNSFSKLTASGLLKLNGYVKGNYNTRNNYFPKYGLSIDIKNGAFQYPGKPMSFNSINFIAALNNKLNHSNVDKIYIPEFEFMLNGKQLNGNLDLQDLNDNSNFKSALKGELDLADLYAAYPMKTIESLAGIITIDAEISGSGHPDRIADALYAGTASIDNIIVKPKDQPKLTIYNAEANLKNNYVNVSSIDGQIGSSDFKGKAEIRQLLSAFTSDAPMEIKANISGEILNLNEFITDQTPLSSSPQSELTDDWRRRAQFDITSNYKKVLYEKYNISDIDVNGSGSLEKFDLKKMTGSVQNSPIELSGKFQNLYNYTFGDGDLLGNLNFSSKKLVLENWMEETPSNGSGSDNKTVYTIIPERVKLNINFKSKEINYGDIKLNQVKGLLSIADQQVVVSGAKGQTLGGGFNIDGLYGYNGDGDPDFNIKYDLSKFSFEKTFAQVETIKLMAPIGKYLDGVYNSNLIMAGKLGEGYLPDFSQLTASGFFETLHGSIRKFEPIQAAAQKLKISSLDDINLDYTRNWFDIKDGYCEIKPFNKTVEGIDMNISGRHKILGDMAYVIRMNIPIEKFEKLGVPTILRDNWNTLAKKIGGSGFNIPGMDMVTVDVLINGKISNPKLDFKIVNFKEKSTGEVVEEIIDDVVDQVKDTVTTIINDTKEIIQDSVTTIITDVKDTITSQVEEKIDSISVEITDRIEDEIKNKIDSTLQDSAKTIIKDVLGDDVKSEIDKLKDKLGGWKPFKK